MVEVIATSRGYYGQTLREPGDRFDAKGTASWFEPTKAGAGGGDQAAPEDDGEPDLSGLTVIDLREMAKERGIAIPKTATTKAAIIDAINGVHQAPASAPVPTANPFSDPPAPEPIRVQNEVNDLTGATQPDWVQG